jgi:hypothetical protein
MLGLVQIQIWLESLAVLILGSKPSTALAATNTTTTSTLQITRPAAVLPQRANSMEGWLDLTKNSDGTQLMAVPPSATSTTGTLSLYLIDQPADRPRIENVNFDDPVFYQHFAN